MERLGVFREEKLHEQQTVNQNKHKVLIKEAKKFKFDIFSKIRHL